MRVAPCLALVLLCACSRKKEEAPAAPPPVPPAAATTSASVEKMVEKPVADAAASAPDDAIESDFVPREDLVLPEGKLVNIGKIVPATKDVVTAHADRLQTEFEAQVKDGCKELGRFNASFVPATYVSCKKDARIGKGGAPSTNEEWRLLQVEGVSATTITYDGEAGGAWELWNTPRGYFVDLGDKRLTYILRRSVKTGGTHWDCVGKSWSPDEGAVKDVKVPDYPTRGKDVDGDGKPEFPSIAFSFTLVGFSRSTPAKAETVCNVAIPDAMTIDVLGLGGDGDRPFFEHRLRDARARATKAQKRGDVRRKSGSLRFTNACAIDLAQIAAELFVYRRMLGASADDAVVETDAVMKDRTLKGGECGGLTSSGGEASLDQWSAMRAALLSWEPTETYEADDAGAAKTDAKSD